MADLNKTVADRSANQVASGAYGNANVARFRYTAAAAQIGDIIYFGKLPAGAVLTDFREVHAALGATSTLKFGYTKVDTGGTQANDDDYFLTATSTASAGGTRMLVGAVPVELTEDMYLIGTVAGAAITGQVDVVVEYEFIGQ